MRPDDTRTTSGITAAATDLSSVRAPWLSSAGMWFGKASMVLALLSGGWGTSWGLDPSAASNTASIAQPAPSSPSSLITLDSDDGQRLLFGSSARRAYGPLSIHFVTQQHPAYCGVATMAMLLNAMDIEAPVLQGFEPHRQFTQDNVLDQATEAVLPRAVLVEQGMTLAQFARLLDVRGRVSTAPGGMAGSTAGSAGGSPKAALTTEVRHADDSSVDRFRREASAALAEPGQHVAVNYLRPLIGQGQGGHISPLGAYDAASDRFLILDVARYRYAPVWVHTADLYAAMNTVDASADGRRRGYVLIRAAR